ncbi:MAG: corrinoid protein [Nitrospirae bacterium]|nr:corrinoid protein [Nitrospirota bacterium]
MEELKRVAEKVEKGKHLEVPEEVRKALDKGIPPYDILISGLQAGLAVIGERFKRDECFIPEVLLSARAMHAGIDLLRPLLAQAGTEPFAKIVLGTVKDDLHDIGKNMVGMMLEGSGFRVVDIGINVPADRFAEVVQKEGASILAMSALLSTTMPYLKTTIDALKEKGIRDRVKVLVGGAPVTEEYAMAVGADGFAPDAARAVDKAKELLNIRA